ncbi:MAG: HlyD family secretion protein, partial [Cyanobacteria bacterium J06621_12]
MSLSRLFGKYGIVLSLLIILSGCNNNSQAQSEDAATENETQIQSQQVVALGKLTPKGEVIKLSVANAEDSRVNQILVEEGDRVEENQVIAILQGFENRQRDLEEAEKEVELAQARLAQVRAGETKQAELAAQRASISRLESQLRNQTLEKQAAIASTEAQLRQARLTYDRNFTLQREGAVAMEAFDQSKEGLDMAQAALNERLAQLDNTQQSLQEEINQEREKLAQLQEIRPVDVKVAEIEL